MTFPTYRLRRALIGLLGVVLAACSALPQGSIQTPPIATAPTGEPSPTAPGYVLAVGDEVELRFADRPDMIHTLRVQPDGSLTDREIFGPSSLGTGVIDGIAFDAYGNLWATMILAERLIAITPQGDVLELLDCGDHLMG